MEDTVAFPTLDQCDSGCDCIGTRAAEESRRSWKVEGCLSRASLFVMYFSRPSFLLADQAAPGTPEEKAENRCSEDQSYFLFVCRAT